MDLKRVLQEFFIHEFAVTYFKHPGMKKIVLFAAAGMLATATIVYATVEERNAPKKEAVKKEVKVKKSNSCNRSTHHCVL